MLKKLTIFIASILSLLAFSVNLLAVCEILPLPQKYREGSRSVNPSKLNVEYTKVGAFDAVPAHAQGEAYSLKMTPRGIQIKYVSEQGKFWAEQTLRQLKALGAKVPECDITDWPAYPIRGFMQDVGRTYIPVEELKREIDLLSRYKINVFHWHLTENQGWRLESKKYPELNADKNFTRMPGKYYTLSEARELVKFCRERHVMLLPEIDMPGHSAAFVRAFGCDMQSEKGMKIVQDLMDEIITQAFPQKDNDVVPYIHIGTDEVKITNPKFVPEMVAFIRARGKKVGTWHPGAKYKPGEIDLVHMWSARGRPLAGTPSIDSRLHYINHFDAFADPVSMYFSQLGEKPEADGTIAGGIIGMWHDRYIEDTNEILAQNGFYPHLLFFAETSWKGGRTKYFKETGTNIALEGEELDQLRDFERRLMLAKRELQNEVGNLPFAYVPQADILWRITDAFPNGGDLKKAFPPENTLKKEYNFDGKTYKTNLARGAGIYLRHTWGGVGSSRLVATHYKNPQPNHTAYAYTWVYSPKTQTVGLWAQTQNYSRSETDLAPQPGKWDYRESKFWLNDKEIPAPKWNPASGKRGNERPLRNENFEVRPPIKVELKQGWNKVLIKLPIGKFSTGEARLTKWMFTFVFVTPDGKNAIPNLVYSPDQQK